MIPDDWKPAIEQAGRDNLKKGDPVICASVHQKVVMMHVTRTTPAQIIIKFENTNAEYRYLKRNGRRIGPSSGWLVMPEVDKC